MKKNRLKKLHFLKIAVLRHGINKNVLLLGLFMLFGLWNFASAQTKSVTLDVKDMPLREVFKLVKTQTGANFIYSEIEIQKASNVTLKFENLPLKTALEKIFKDQPYTFEIQGDIVVVKPANQKSVNQEKQKISVIKGKVVGEDGLPIPGVNILLKGTMIGVLSDADGVFKMEVPAMDDIVVVFSFVGMKTQEIAYKGEADLHIIMQEDVTEVDEVVVTGIFKKSKESYTGAVSVITEKELKSFGNRNVLTTLRNIDPSFNIMENNTWGSNPNKLPEIEIRGAASMPDVNQLQSDVKADLNTPLIIMDGFEITLQRMMDLDDNEVKSITLLKDASATAIYGSRGANGVIVIETKEPEAGKLKLTYTGSLNLEIPDLSDYDVLDAREKLDLEYRSGYYDHARAEHDLRLKQKYNKILQDIDRGVNTYWLSRPLQTGVGHRHNLKIEGGDQSFRYSATLQFNHVAGVMKESFRNNFNGGINLSYKHEKLIFRNSLTLSLNKTQDSPYGTFDEYVKLNPYWTPKDENGNIKRYFDEDDLYWGTGKYPANPLYNATLNSKATTDYTNIINNFSIEWKPTMGLTIQGRFGITTQTSNGDTYYPPEHTRFSEFKDEDFFRKGSYSYKTGKDFRYNASVTANYSTLLNDRHLFYAGVNWELEESKGHDYRFEVQGFPSGSLDFLAAAMQYAKDGIPDGSESTSRRVSMVGNLNYSYDERYFVDVSYRMDGSSLYGSDRRFAGFWAAGIGWNIHQEKFMETLSFVNRLKLRGSLGETGSNNFSSYESLATYKYVLNDRYYQWTGAKMQALPNPDLEWQKTMKYDVGLDMNLFNNRLSIVADFYLEKTRGLMSSLELPASNGFPSYKANIGELENRGFELRATYYVLRDTERRLIWTVTGALVHNKDKILKLSKAMQEANQSLQRTQSTTPNQVWKEGDPMNAIYVVPSLGIDPSTGKELYLKKNGEVTYNWDVDDRVFYGVSQPKYRGNINTTVRYRDLSLNMSFGYYWGGQQYNSTLIDRVENADKKYNVDARVYQDRWKEAGDRTFFKGINETGTTWASSRFVQDENVFTCQNINLTYELRQNEWLQKNIGIETLILKGDIADLFRISSIKQERGIYYPFSRQFSCSLTLMF